MTSDGRRKTYLVALGAALHSAQAAHARGVAAGQDLRQAAGLAQAVAVEADGALHAASRSTVSSGSAACRAYIAADIQGRSPALPTQQRLIGGKGATLADLCLC